MDKLKRLFVSAEVNKLLKENGFIETCIAISKDGKYFFGEFHSRHEYYKEFGQIANQQACEWFFDIHKIKIHEVLAIHPLNHFCFKINDLKQSRVLGGGSFVDTIWSDDYIDGLTLAYDKAFFFLLNPGTPRQF